MSWMDGDSVVEAAPNGGWELLVELRTGFPEIRAAFASGNVVTAGRCLDRLARKACTVGPVLSGWPTIASDVATAARQLKADPDNVDAWQRLSTLADELEAAIAQEAAHRSLSDDDRP